MIYQPRDTKRRSQKRAVSVLIIFAIAAIVGLINWLSPQLFMPATHAAGVPIMYSQAAVENATDTIWGVLKSKRTLLEHNRSLREQLALMEATVLEKNILTEENESLRKLLGRENASTTSIVARIISKPGFSPYDTIIIDAGDQEGVVVGDTVVVNGSVLVGKVATTAAHSSNVVLYSSPEQKVQVLIGPQAVETTAFGKGGGNFEVKLPRNASIKEGDSVVMAEHPEYIFGAITSIQISDADSFEKVLFRSAIDVTETKFVTVEQPIK
ncbi:MAG: rod shape-determining protein MreC [Patescibacteria group bacterium]